MARRKKDPEFPDAEIDALIAGTKTAADLEVLFSRLKKRMIERILGGELTSHLGYAPEVSRRSWCRRACGACRSLMPRCSRSTRAA